MAIKCFNTLCLFILSGQKKDGSRGITMTYRSMWKITKGKKIEVAMKVLKQEVCEKYSKVRS